MGDATESDTELERLFSDALAGIDSKCDNALLAYTREFIIIRYFRSRNLKDADCDDLAQDVITTVARKWRQQLRVRTPGGFTNWVRAISGRRLSRFFNTQMAQLTVNEPADPYSESNPSDGLVFKELVQRLRLKLTPTQIRVLDQAVLGKYSTAEIADACGCDERTVRRCFDHIRVAYDLLQKQDLHPQLPRKEG